MSEKNITAREIRKYVGDISQLFGVKDYRMSGGKAEGVRAVDIKNGSGLEYTVLPDRGLDIAYLSYKSTNISYISKTGIVAPQYFDKSGLSFLRSFYAGFLTTCGLTYARDLKAAYVLNENLCGNDLVAFHCQQSIEKALKGAIIYFSKQLEEGHSLVYLCKQAEKHEGSRSST